MVFILLFTGFSEMAVGVGDTSHCKRICGVRGFIICDLGLKLSTSVFDGDHV